VVRSKNGRFRNELFVVLNIDGEYAGLVNGKQRKVNNPKRKKVKHLELGIGHSNHIEEKLLKTEKVTNNEVRITLSSYTIGREHS
jgi:ribosomal protein L14E/L6E/L27E